MTSASTPAKTSTTAATTTSGATLARIAVRSTVWTTVGNYLNQFVGFVAVLVLTRLLLPDIFGAFALATFWFTLLNVRSKLGLNYAAAQYGPTDGALLGTYLALDVGAALLSLALAVIAAAVFAVTGLYSREVIVVLCVLTMVDSASSLVGPLSVALEKELQLSRLALVTLISSLIAYPIAIALAYLGGGIWSMLAISILTGLISMIGVVIVSRLRLPSTFALKWQFDRDVAKRLLKQGLVAGLSLALLTIVVAQFDNFLIGTFVDNTTLGYYDRAYRITSWPNLLLTLVITRVGFLTMAKLKDDWPRLTHTVRLNLWIVLMLGIPMALVLFFGAPDVVSVLYGPRYAESVPFLRFLAMTNFMWILISVGFWLSIALGDRKASVLLTGAQATMLVVAGVPLTLQFGTAGTLIAVACSMTLALILSNIYVFRTVPLKAGETFGAAIVGAVVAALTLVAFSLSGVWNESPPLVRLVATTAVTFVAFGGCMLLLRRDETIERIAYLRRAWRKE